MPDSAKYRLVTRSDFDGLVCAVLLKELGLIDDILFVHPKDMQDGKVAITSRDITTNLPYVEGVALAFDHHVSETIRLKGRRDNHVIDPDAPSAARVVYHYYGGRKRFPSLPLDMMRAVDKADSARFSRGDILKPKGWVLLSFIMDARTGLGRFRDFRISNFQLMTDLIGYCKVNPIDKILEMPDVKERVDLYNAQARHFKAQLKRCMTIHGNVAVLDLRREEIIYAGNRFMIYARAPECNISVHVLWGVQRQNTVLAIGKSIFKKDNPVNIGELALKYGGGDHANAGTCQVPNEDADRVLAEIVPQLDAAGA